MFSPKSVANCFIDIAQAAGEKLTPMKLQKLVYYAVGWYAGATRKPLVDEAVEAWQYGPVVPSLYHEFKKFGSGAITEKATDINDDFEIVEVPVPEDKDVRKFLANIWKSYGKFSGIKLSEMSHVSGGPWDETWSATCGMRGIDIPFDLMQTYFGKAVEKARATRAAS